MLTWCVSSCFTVIVLLSFLTVAADLVCVSHHCPETAPHYQVNACPEPARGTARTQRQLIQNPLAAWLAAAIKNCDLFMHGLSSELGFLHPSVF